MTIHSAMTWTAFILIGTGGAAFAQTDARVVGNPTQKSAMAEEQARFKQCIKDWDAKTHMTRHDWERTCRRVTAERVKFLRERMSGTPEQKKAQPRAK